VKVAAAQTAVSPDIAANGAAIRAAIETAAAEGARLVVFCEGALSGYAKAQIANPGDWGRFDWTAQEAELRSIAALCGDLKVHAAVGGAHRLDASDRPHNSLYVLSDEGRLATRYDKRLLSFSEVSDWYTPGREPVTFAVDGTRFGCAICIEAQFAEVFMDYERMGVDAVLFASYGIPRSFQIALQAHASLNCLWIVAAAPAQKSGKGPAGIIGPDGEWMAQASASSVGALATAEIDRADPRFDIALNKARPWRATARRGDVYRERMVEDARSGQRGEY
jgi:predicted amidohydrolase